MAIRGVTYSNQRVSAADHAALFQMFITDGIINGCGASSQLNVLTISEGAFIVAGRMTYIQGSERITMPTDGTGEGTDKRYARIIGRCNMNQTATKQLFSQFGWRIEYAATTEGFGELTKENINFGGKIYEVEWAILTLGANGIIEKVEQSITQSHGHPAASRWSAAPCSPARPKN